MRRGSFVACGLVALCAVVAFGSNGRAAAPKYESVLIKDVPHIRQRPDFCGEACAAMYLRKLGSRVHQDGVFAASGLDPVLGRGCYTRELVRGLERLGFEPGGPTTVNAAKSTEELESQWRTMHADLVRGVGSIACMHYDDSEGATEHFRLILGYDASKDEVIYHEPAEDRAAYRRMKRSTFLSLWPLKYEEKKWTVVRLPLKVRKLVEWPDDPRPNDAEYAQHVMQLKKILPSESGQRFHIVIERPFVVIGDESAERVRERAINTVRWAVVRLKKEYFAHNPDQILDIWLFKDSESYERNAEKLFGEKPTTPYGYFSPQHRALVMNISTGGGTLVHEIVHPFMSSNFPRCPSWFNEGLASLYEQSSERDGRIRGETNWRLAGLQRAIAAKRLPSFEALTKTSTDEFYRGDHSATNYAQARYLCYYLQEQGKLVDYYREFRKTALSDPTGYEALKAVLKEKDMGAFQKRWEAYVAKLRFP